MRKYLLKVVSHVNVITGIDPRKKKWFISQKDLRHIELQFSWGFLSFAATKGVNFSAAGPCFSLSHFKAFQLLCSSPPSLILPRQHSDRKQEEQQCQTDQSCPLCQDLACCCSSTWWWNVMMMATKAMMVINIMMMAMLAMVS